MERKTKGAFLKDVVIGIKSDKLHQKEYNDLLSDEAKEFLNQRILNSAWYPYELHRELYNALIKIAAKDNRETVIKWGAKFGEGVMVTLYKNFIVEGKLRKLIEIYPRFHRITHNFGTLTPEWISENEILFTYKDYDQDFEMLYYSNVGWTKRAIELCIKKEVNYTFLKKSWEGDDVTQFKLFWTP